MPVYQVVYDARDASGSASLWLMVFFVVGGLALWFAGWADQRLWRQVGTTAVADTGGADEHPYARAGRVRRIAMWAAFAGVLVNGSLWWVDVFERNRLREALETGDYTVVEGQVTDFVRGDRGGNREERFTVMSEGRRYGYEYSSANLKPGFHESHGPIRDGLQVRISDVDGYIARLEIAR